MLDEQGRIAGCSAVKVNGQTWLDGCHGAGKWVQSKSMIQTIVDQNTLFCIYTVFTPAESPLSTHFPKMPSVEFLAMLTRLLFVSLNQTLTPATIRAISADIYLYESDRCHGSRLGAAS